MNRRTFVYVDGFNLYYRLLRAAPQYKWLNPKLLADNMLEETNKILRVNYYSARVSGAIKLDAPAKQQRYLDALNSVPEVRITMGNFLSSECWSPLCIPPTFKPKTELMPPHPTVVRTRKMEEKGSDVNLASHLVRDALLDEFDVAVIITNDTDLCEAVRIATKEANKIVGLLSPVKHPAQSLLNLVNFSKRIRQSHLSQSQFPSPLPGTDITRPEDWV